MRLKLQAVFGWMAIVFFVAIYGVELLPHHGPPITIRWIRDTFGQTSLILLNILIVLAFLTLIPYRRPTKNIWKSQGTFIAFTIALMTEMFGWPLFIFLFSPLVNIPLFAREYFRIVGHWPATVGTAISILGLVLIAIGWAQIHKAEGLVTTGIYRYIKHPQYTGIFLFTFGWILHWPSFLTLILWPILVAAYVWLAKQEEKQAIEEFGEAYMEYSCRTKRFIIFVIAFLLSVTLSRANSWSWDPFGRFRGMMDMHSGNTSNDMCPMMGRMPVKGIARKALPESESIGAELYSQYCSQCHALPSPKAHSAREWEESLARMDAQMQMMGRMRMMKMCRMMNVEAPNGGEKEIILSYLQKHALKVIKEQELPAPESKGALLFKDTCSQCHDLPGPKNHTAEEWPRIVENMTDFIRELKQGTQLSDQDKERIIQYLQEYSKLDGSQSARKTK